MTMLKFSVSRISLHLSSCKMIKRIIVGWTISRMDETYTKLKGVCCYLYRTVNKSDNTVDFLLTRRRQRMNAQSFLIKAILLNVNQ